MVWIPPRKQRAEIRRRFAELVNPPKTAKTRLVKKRSVAAKFSSAKVASTAPQVNEQSIGATEMPKKPPVESCAPTSPAVRVDNAGPRRSDDEQPSIHHIPPRNPKIYTRKRVTRKVHQAYHAIFGASPSFEACVEILRRDWWPNADSTSAEEGKRTFCH
jgi:hypothetical protein